MSIFSNPFFSVAGQKERLSNAAAVLGIAANPFRKDRIKANTSSVKANKALEVVANNPYSTAAVATVVANPSAALQVGKQAGTSVAKAVGKSFVTAPIPTSAAVLIGAPVVAGVIRQKPELLVDLPKTSYNAGKGLVDVIERNPVQAALIGGVTGGLLAYEAGSAIFGDDAPSPAAALPSSNIPPGAVASSPDVASEPLTRETQVLGKEVRSGTPRKRKRRTLQKAAASNNIRILNQNTYIQARR